MLNTCPACGNWQRDKLADATHIRCPHCDAVWPYRRLPLLVLTGASGVGKTTAGRRLLARLSVEDAPPFLVEDADFFYTLLPHKTPADDQKQVEEMLVLSATLAQSGRPVLWTMAGNLDKLPHTYAARFFSGIHCLALVCSEDALRVRMQQGRGITDQGWLNSSVEYNRYFQTHSTIGETSFTTLDTTELSPDAVADRVWNWAEALCK